MFKFGRKYISRTNSHQLILEYFQDQLQMSMGIPKKYMNPYSLMDIFGSINKK